MLIETVEERLSEECGCPEHDIMLNHISATVHMEKNGDGEAFVDFGDWQEYRYTIFSKNHPYTFDRLRNFIKVVFITWPFGMSHDSCLRSQNYRNQTIYL